MIRLALLCRSNAWRHRASRRSRGRRAVDRRRSTGLTSATDAVGVEAHGRPRYRTGVVAGTIDRSAGLELEARRQAPVRSIEFRQVSPDAGSTLRDHTGFENVLTATLTRARRSSTTGAATTLNGLPACSRRTSDYAFAADDGQNAQPVAEHEVIALTTAASFWDQPRRPVCPVVGGSAVIAGQRMDLATG